MDQGKKAGGHKLRLLGRRRERQGRRHGLHNSREHPRQSLVGDDQDDVEEELITTDARKYFYRQMRTPSMF